MTEQELEKKIRQSGVEDRESVEYFIDLAKAYADAQVEASVARQQPIFEAAMNAKDTEIAELKAEWDKTRNYLVERVDKAEVANAKLKAEIKRLRDGVNSALYGLRATHAMSKDDSRRMRKVGSVLKSLLSRAPVTESRHPIALQMYKCNNCQWRGQVGESIETETCDVCPECKSEDLLLYNENEDQE